MAETRCLQLRDRLANPQAGGECPACRRRGRRLGREIERKFLVIGDGWRQDADGGTPLRQGYLIGARQCSVRVRTAGAAAWLNLKGATLGVERTEFEYPIPPDDAAEILHELCEQPLVEKTRYRVPVGDHVWEVDCFEGANRGLVVAEVELDHPDEAFQRPEWIGAEVSHLPRYYNVALVRHPYRDWSEAERSGE